MAGLRFCGYFQLPGVTRNYAPSHGHYMPPLCAYRATSCSHRAPAMFPLCQAIPHHTIPCNTPYAMPLYTLIAHMHTMPCYTPLATVPYTKLCGRPARGSNYVIQMHWRSIWRATRAQRAIPPCMHHVLPLAVFMVVAAMAALRAPCRHNDQQALGHPHCHPEAALVPTQGCHSPRRDAIPHAGG